MRYREIKPNASAARFVKCYWLMDDDAPLPNPQRIVPDGRAQLILNLAHPYEGIRRKTSACARGKGDRSRQAFSAKRFHVAFFQDERGPLT